MSPRQFPNKRGGSERGGGGVGSQYPWSASESGSVCSEQDNTYTKDRCEKSFRSCKLIVRQEAVLKILEENDFLTRSLERK